MLKILSNLDALKNSQKVIHLRATLKKIIEEGDKETGYMGLKKGFLK
jgi:hypothetical protein